MTTMENEQLLTLYETIISSMLLELKQMIKRDTLSKDTIKDLIFRYGILAGMQPETRKYVKKADRLDEETKWIKAHDARKAAEYSEEVDNLAKLSRALRDQSKEYEYDESKIANVINEQTAKAA
jgi:hypothetical protein